MAGGRGYQDLIAWQKAMDLAEATYRATGDWPTDERYKLTDQVRRSAISIPSNIAEGQGRGSTREFAYHLSVAHGSLCELETQLRLSQRLSYVDATVLDALLQQAAEVGRLIQGLLRKLRSPASS
ncbi:MAG: four helix bundle protein [Chloroflexota bacterium]|nr:four helix bundle protein [Chloroflexota bacterium]